jgi:NosR/NirI family transcriptional regulator, nitrous oxide reductase regulator
VAIWQSDRGASPPARWRRLAALAMLLTTAGAAVADGRIFTNPDQGAHLKALFPTAVAFSTLEGTPLHYSAFAVDPKTHPDARPIGYAFWTTDMVPDEHGYHGPIHILVGLDRTGIITGVVVDYDSEPYGYFSVEPQKFADQFAGKSIFDPFRVGGDVAAVSRASLSVNSATRAIRDSSRAVARALLDPAAVKHP